MEISFTQFRVHAECPWKYKLNFVDRKRIPQTAPSSLGSSLHRALECFHRSKTRDLDALIDCYNSRWVKGGYASPIEADEYYAKGARALEKYLEREGARRTEVVGIEREFFYPLGRHTVRGMVDRVDRHPDGRHEVIDYKTSLRSDTEADGSALLQLRFYALGLKECLGIQPALLTVHYLAADKLETVAYDPSGEAELKARIEAAADAIEEGGFPPDTSFCARCDFRLTCAHSIAKS